MGNWQLVIRGTSAKLPITNYQLPETNSALPLLVPRVGFADHAQNAVAPHDHAVFTDTLHARTNFHGHHSRFQSADQSAGGLPIRFGFLFKVSSSVSRGK
jgi:hypothetical protein